jgi:secreted Zn-dependent insulinase-like peptidase
VVTASSRDPRDYRYIELRNGLRALLVSDPEADTAGAAVDVGVGSLADPRAYAGLAHLLEHELFLGTAKYPDENEYNAFLASHGGASNAYTDSEHTNYYFSVDARAGLPGALDRFAQFFVAPLLNASALAREMHAVDSEHKKNLQSDGWRLFQVIKELAAPDAPFHGFSTGNLATLDHPDTRAALAAFHSLHYTAPNMRLTVVGRESLDALQTLVAALFADVPAAPRRVGEDAVTAAAVAGLGPATVATAVAAVAQAAAAASPPTPAARANMSAPTWWEMGGGGAAFPSARRGVEVLVAPVAEVHEVNIMWPLPPQTGDQVTRTRAVDFLCTLIGDEGVGSLLSYLRAQRLATSLSAGLDVDTAGFSLLQVSATLDPQAVQAATQEAADATGEAATASALTAALQKRARIVLAAVLDYVRMAAAQVAIAEAAHTALGTVARDPTSGLVYAMGGPAGSGAALVVWPASLAASNDATRFWAEWLSVQEAAFAFPQRSEASGLASRLARLMHRAGPADVLSPPSRLVWHPPAVAFLLRGLVPEAAIVMLVSKALPTASLTLAEPVYGTRYAAAPLPDTLRQSLGAAPDGYLSGFGLPVPAFTLPPRNRYLPAAVVGEGKDPFAVRPQPLAPTAAAVAAAVSQCGVSLAVPSAPVLYNLGPTLHAVAAPAFTAAGSALTASLWWLPDNRFRYPRTHVAVHLHSPAAAESPIASLLTGLYIAAVQEGLREQLYAAARGGTGIEVGGVGFGGGVSFSAVGYSPGVASALPDALATAPRRPVAGVTPAFLASALAGMVDELRNGAAYQQPYQAALYVHALLAGSRRWSLQQLMLGAAALAGMPLDGGNATEALLGAAGAPPPPFAVANVSTLAAAVATHADVLFARATEVVVVVYGNEDHASAVDLSTEVLRRLFHEPPAPPAPLPAPITDSTAARALACVRPAAPGAEGEGYAQVATLPPGNSAYVARADNAAEPNSATVVMYQLGLRDSGRSG